MKKTITLLASTLFILLMTGCVSTSLTSDIDPNTNLNTIQSVYVARQPNDKLGINKMIADELKKYGKETSYGDTAKAPAKVDAVITYVDKWMWDITNYILSLTIEVRDPETDYKLASGQSFRTSLARKPPEFMVEEVTGKIFGIENKKE